MEFGFHLSSLSGEKGGSRITCWDSGKLGRLKADEQTNMATLINAFGIRSARAQALNTAVTDIKRILTTDQRLYIQTSSSAGKTILYGGLKVGRKDLYISTDTGPMRKIRPTCVLDFYVPEPCQRAGIGRQIFENFLKMENYSASNLAYDRPSSKLISFLRKHYGLADYTPQNNKFVVFKSFFKPTMMQRGESRKDDSQSLAQSDCEKMYIHDQSCNADEGADQGSGEVQDAQTSQGSYIQDNEHHRNRSVPFHSSAGVAACLRW